MSYEAIVLNVLIASPRDTVEARDRVEQVMMSWNRDRSRTRKVVLLSLRWENDAVAELGRGDGQSVINSQLVDKSDIVVALFHSRLGGPTSRAVSGTAEEIDRAVDAGSKVHVYFSEMPRSSDVDIDQLSALREFQSEMQSRGLVGSYASYDDLATKIRTALERDIDDLLTIVTSLGQAADNGLPTGAILRATYEYAREPETDSRGKVRMRTRREKLVIENIGAAVAENIEVFVEAESEGEPPSLHGESVAGRLLAHGKVEFPLMTFAGIADRWLVIMRWNEGGRQFEEKQTVTAV